MDIPEGFDGWSDECKERFRRLKRESDERDEAVRARDQAAAAAEAATDAAEAAEEAVDDADAELAEIGDRLDNYAANRRVQKQVCNAAKAAWQQTKATESAALTTLQQSLSRDVKAGTKTYDEARTEYQAAKAAATTRVQAAKTAYEDCKDAYDELKTQRRLDKARKRELELGADEREAAQDAAQAAKDAADRVAATAAAALASLRSADQIRDDYFKMVRECGPQDPVPGGPAIPVPLGMVVPTDDGEPVGDYYFDSEDVYGGPGGVRLAGENAWQDDTVDYLLSLAPQRPAAFHLNRFAIHTAGYPVSDELEHLEPEEGFVPLEEIEAIEIEDPPARTWHTGCIEFLWVQGTTPEVDGRLVSNPITRTVAQAVGDVNEIFAGCCVRFTAFLKIVTFKQLEGLADAAQGISIKGGTTKAVSKEKIHPNLGAFIKAMQDHPECASFLVVDEIDGAAGYAGLGTRRGIVTMETVGKSKLGDTTAHEVGHAVGGIPHVVNEGKPNERKHEHGELMWGEGCVDHPTAQAIRYSRVTDTDCAQMRANTTDTGERCEDRNA